MPVFAANMPELLDPAVMSRGRKRGAHAAHVEPMLWAHADAVEPMLWAMRGGNRQTG